MDIRILEEAGLSKTEARVYLALLELGSALAGDITKKSEVNRTNVYDALERLIEKGLVTYVISANRKVFEPVGPERLQELLKDKQEKIDSIMPELKLIYETSKVKEEATIFKGRKGIKTLFEDALKEKREIFIYGGQARFSTMFPAYAKHWNERRAELGIRLSMIWNEKVRKQQLKKGWKLIRKRFLPPSYDFPSTVMVYGEKVVTCVWTELPFAFMIKSKEAVKSQTHFFNLLWGIAKK